MGGQRVSDSPEDKEPIVLRKVFKEQFPYYLQMGMTYNQYWNCDCTLARDYRKAYELRQEYDNQQAWLLGMYIYDAVNRLRPGFAFYGNKPPKIEKYMDKPIAITESMKDRYASEKATKMAEQLRAAFHDRNQRMAEKEVSEDGDSGNVRDKDTV